jgi:hypothetical protein
MMAQCVEGLPGARLDEQRQRVSLDIEEALCGMDEIENAYETKNTEGLAISETMARSFEPFCRGIAALERSPRLLKGHATGPVTLALGLPTNYEERAAIYEPDLAHMVARVAGLKARWQEDRFKTVAPQSETLILFDEPTLGSLGSAVLNLDADLAVEMLDTAARACSGLPGVHLCGETDLGIIAATSIKVLNFDAYTYLDSLVASGPQVRTFVEGGGLLAIGLVPSSLPHPEAVAKESLESLLARLDQVMDILTRTGLDRELIVRRSFLTPSCGTGGMTPELAQRTLTLTNEIADQARERYR